MIKVSKVENGYAIEFCGDRKHFNFFMHTLSNVETKIYDFTLKAWVVPDLMELGQFFDYQLESDPDLYDDIGKSMKLQPYSYQKEAIKFCLDNMKALMVLPCGSGKTILAIGAYMESIERGIIEGPGVIVVKASLKTQWKKEVEKFSDLNASVIKTKPALCLNENNRLRQREKKISSLNPVADKKQYSSLKKEIAEIEKEIENKFNNQFDADLIILNYESLCNEDIKEKLHSIKPQFVIADEIHYSKSHKAKRSKALHEFGYAKMTIGATATPIQKSYQDAYGIFKFIQTDLWSSFSKFAASYIKYSGPGRISGYKNVDNLRKKISPYMFIKTKKEISSQLPSLVVMQRYCDLDESVIERTQEIYLELEQLHEQEKSIVSKMTSEAELESNPELMKIEGKIMALQTFAQQLADAPEMLELNNSEMAKQYMCPKAENLKIELLADIVEEIIESGEKVCIFSKFKSIQPILARRLMKIDKALKIAYVNGSIKDERRYEEIYTKFRDNDDYKVLIATNAMAEGSNLSKCKYIIEYDLADSYAIQTQRHGRVERADSVHDNVFVYQLIGNGSYDEVALKIINKKQGYDHEIVTRIKHNDI